MEEKADRRPVSAPPGTVSLELGEREAEGIYSNLFVISHSSSEVVLDFARALPGVSKSKVYARIIMTPQHAKSLQLALAQNLAKFEEQFGPVHLPGSETRADKKGIGF